MSTRSNIQVTDGDDTLHFYQHSDGYPSGQKALIRFVQCLAEGSIRNDIEQASGWLIVFGHRNLEEHRKEMSMALGITNNHDDWRASFVEPAVGVHGDEEWFYEINLKTAMLRIYEGDTLVRNMSFEDITEDEMEQIEEEARQDMFE